MKSRDTLRQLIFKVTLWTIIASMVASGTAFALTINLTYDPDSTFMAAGLSAQNIIDMKAAATYAATQLTNNYSDPINVNIKVTAVAGTGTLGMSSTFLLSTSYANIRTAVINDATTADDTTTIGAGGVLPAADPIGGSHMYFLSRAQAKALSLLANDMTNDGTFTFGGGQPYTYDPANRAVAGKFDFIGVAMHEFSEIMGRIGVMGVDIGTGSPGYMLFDLYHYTAPGVRGLNNGPGRFFSFDNGTNLLKAFNNAAMNGGDLQDWASGTNDCFNAFSDLGVQNDLTTVDLRNMDVIGYNRASAAPTVTSAVSRKTHGGAGNFDIDLPLTGPSGVECRSNSGTNDFTMIVTFTTNVTVSGSPQAQVTMGTGTIGSGGVSNGGAVTVAGSVVTIPLTNVADQQTINVTLNGVNASSIDELNEPAANIVIPMGRLTGDTQGNRAVNASDTSVTKSRIGQVVNAANFRSDVNANGSINAGDASLVKANSGHALP